MQIYLILALIIALLAVIFAVQNVAIVSISFFVWNIQVPLAVALLAALGAGVLITILLSIPGKVKGSWNSVSSKKKFSSLEAERDSLKLKVEETALDRDRSIKKLEASEREITKLEEELASLAAALQEAEKRSDLIAPPTELSPDAAPPAEITTGTVGEDSSE